MNSFIDDVNAELSGHGIAIAEDGSVTYKGKKSACTIQMAQSHDHDLSSDIHDEIVRTILAECKAELGEL